MSNKPLLAWSPLLFLFFSLNSLSQCDNSSFQYIQGAIVRGDSSSPSLALVFTGDEYADGGKHIAEILKKHGIKASFFLTGKFYRNPDFESILQTLSKNGHYLGAHSDQHLLYCDWTRRDSLLVSREEFESDLENNYSALSAFLNPKEEAYYYLPPYEWYNDTISSWTRQMGLQLVNYTSGTLSHADYTLPGTSQYRGSQEIYDSILNYESNNPSGLNGFILLSHIGTHPERTDKFYFHLDSLIKELKQRGYSFKRIDELL
jgi:peptidoglycan/xylan/chitin deacetylase (PgdA/CDA1 family)